MCVCTKSRNTECLNSKTNQEWRRPSKEQRKMWRRTDAQNATWNLQHQSCVICTFVRSTFEPKISVSAKGYQTLVWTVNSVPSRPCSPSNSVITWPVSIVMAASKRSKMKTAMTWITQWLLMMTLAVKISSCSQLKTAHWKPISVRRWPWNFLFGTAWQTQSL